MATINLDGDETVLYGPGFQTSVLSPGLGATARPIAVVTDPVDGDTLVYRDGAFQNESLDTFVQDTFVDITGDTMTGDLIVQESNTNPRIVSRATGSGNAELVAYDTTDGGYELAVIDGTLHIAEVDTSGNFVASRIEVDTNGNVVINNSGADADVRIEGDTDANLLVVNAGTDRVGIGTNTPTTKLDVAGDATIQGGSSPGLHITHTGAAADTGKWKLTGATDGLRLQVLLDNDSIQELPLRLIRSGGHVSSITLNDSGVDTDIVIEGDTATNLFKTDAGLDAVQIGTTSAGEIADFRSGSIVLNESGADRDTRIEGDADANLLYLDAGNDRVGIGTATPTAKLDVNSDVLRLRTAKTPASAAATGNAGDIAWDSNFLYIAVATNTWKRVAIATW